MAKVCIVCGVSPKQGLTSTGLCGNCWRDRVSYDVKAEFVQAEAVAIHNPSSSLHVQKFQDALRELVSAARFDYRGEQLRKLWKKKWRKKFKARYGAADEAEKIPEPSEDDEGPQEVELEGLVRGSFEA